MNPCTDHAHSLVLVDPEVIELRFSVKRVLCRDGDGTVDFFEFQVCPRCRMNAALDICHDVIMMMGL